MALTIKSQNNLFDLPNDFQIEVEITSPIYNDKGSRTTGSTLPGTKHNLSLVKHCNRMDIVNRPERDRMVLVADGVYRRTGRMNIVTPATSGISCNIGFDESLMYEAWNNVSLKKLPNLPKYQLGGLNELINHIDAVYRYQLSADYYVFPVMVANETIDDTMYPEIINPIVRTAKHTTSEPPKYELIKEERTEKVVISGSLTNIKVPGGYGISPFIKVSKVLELIFEAYGYRLVENPFKTDFQLKKMVLLNNVADTIVEGFIDYKDLMPDCTINDLLHSLFCRTGAQVYVNGNNKTAKIILLKDSINAQPVNDWTLLRATEMKPTYEAGKQLKISAATSFDKTKPAGDNFDDFYSKYAGVIQIYGKPDISEVPADYNMIYHSITGNFYKNDVVTGKTEWISSDFFPWDKKNSDLEYEEIIGDDECVSMNFTPDSILCPQYLAGSTHYHTTLRSSAASDNEEKKETPLAFCFAIGMGKTGANDLPRNMTGYYHGSTMCMNLNGEPFIDDDNNQYYFSLVFRGKQGAFNIFFKDWDAILRHANHLYEGEVNLNKNQLTKLDTSRPVMVAGQKLMIDKVKHNLPTANDKPATVTLRSIKLLKPFNLAEEHFMPDMTPQTTKWIMVSYVDQAYADKVQEIKNKYHTPPNSEVSGFKLEIATEPGEGDFSSYNPPTKEEVEQGKEILKGYLAKVKYTWTYLVFGNQWAFSDVTTEFTYYAGIKAAML